MVNIFKGLEDAGRDGGKKRLTEWFLKKKYTKMFELVTPYVKKDEVILDVGVGDGSVAMFLKRNGYEVTGIDVVDHSLYKNVRPIIYNGKDMTFKDNQFETGIILSVLHHCSDGIRVLQETKRVAKRVIVVEDTYRNWLEKVLVSVRDSVCNFEFYPHHYRTVGEWKRIINKNGWKLITLKEWSSLAYGLYGRQCLMVVDS